MRVLTLSNLFPNAVQPRKGVFVRERLRHMIDLGNIESTVVAPVPWFPSTNPRFGQYAEFASVAKRSESLGQSVYHPRYLAVPKIGSALSPLSYARALRKLIKRESLGPFDVIDAHFFFPDGAAAVLLGRALNIPVAITARGSDLNFMPEEAVAGRWIRWAIKHCDAAIGVSGKLTERLVELGCDSSKAHLLRNGVDRARFLPKAQEKLRERFGVSGPLILSVGNLIELKGHHLVVDALALLPNAHLIIIGKGPERSALQAQADSLGLTARVQFVPEVTQDELVDYYNVADALVLASSSEGMPNVVLESMACGTPVVAASVGGVPEILGQTRTGVLLEERTAKHIAAGVSEVLERAPGAEAVCAEVADFDWQTTAQGVNSLFANLISARQTATP